MFSNKVDIIKSHYSSHGINAKRGAMDYNIIVPILVAFMPINSTLCSKLTLS